MRIWHTLFAVFFVAVGLTLLRDPAGRVAVVVFLIGVAVLICGLTAIMMLFQTVGSIGAARGPGEVGIGVLATAVVLALAATIMAGMVAVGIGLVLAIV
jgi:hypothetical protein